MTATPGPEPPRFERRFFGSAEAFTTIGSGAIGGKAAGLLRAHRLLRTALEAGRFPGIEVGIPRLVTIGTDVFDAFLQRNGLRDRALDEPSDVRIANAFQKADLPAEAVGDLWALVREVKTPLAVRSSSLLEDALRHPFAGVYATKMTPNDAHDPQARFRRLVEAVKLVYASTFFQGARAYVKAAGRDPGDEKMAVVVQEVVGARQGPRFYPEVSGVARSYNYYPSGAARPEDGVLSLALGLGKTIVDGGRCWTVSPRHPRAKPPYGSIGEMLEATQTEFWAVNMGPPPPYDPIAETEYLVRNGLAEAEQDGTLRHTASTYDASADRIVLGLAAAGPRLLDFAPLLVMGEPPLAGLVEALLELCTRELGAHVEIEFAVTFPKGAPARLGFLQVRPMAAPGETVTVGEDDLADPRVLVASEHVLGNGVVEGVRDVVYVKPEAFEMRHTPAIARDLERINRGLVEAGRPYVLIGFGRWGSSDPWLGVPVSWPQVSGAKVIVEAGLAGVNVEMSQGAHFFHNLISFRVAYFSVPERSTRGIDWDRLRRLPALDETDLVRHVELPLEIEVDGHSGRGVVRRQET